ncbi:PRP38 pre-mRNA processing factor 38 domain-containing protein B [Mortierella alpina]|nr:PRP38 pre-mRNA processing factor 38 domain-containing protein B [Mortierella alpina]
MSSNQLATHGNERTMNLNSIIFQNILESPYLKTLNDMVTFQEVVVEAQRNVKSMEPYLKGTTPSTAWVIMYKFWTLPLTVRQLENLIEHPHSVYLRGIGFLYLRYVCKPDQLWDWLGAYLDDDQEIQLQGGVKPVHSTIGKMCYMLLHDQKFLGQILPRIPVLVMRDLEQKLEPYADAGRAKMGQRDHFRKERSDNRDRGSGWGGARDRNDYRGMMVVDRDQKIAEEDVTTTATIIALRAVAVTVEVGAVVETVTVTAETIIAVVAVVEALEDVKEKRHIGSKAAATSRPSSASIFGYGSGMGRAIFGIFASLQREIDGARFLEDVPKEHLSSNAKDRPLECDGLCGDKAEHRTFVNITPNPTPNKFTLSVSRQCSILELKEIIVTRLDTKPSIADLRLIYGGRIPQDKDTLELVFEKVESFDNPPTIHLVVSQRNGPLQQQQQPRSAPASPAPLRFRTNTASATVPHGSSSGNDNTQTTPSETQQGAFCTSNVFTAALPSTETRAENPGSIGGLPLTGGYAPAAFAPAPWQTPMQYAIVNGMPYLIPAAYLPMLHFQQHMQHMPYAPLPLYGAVLMNADGTPSLQPIPTIFTPQQIRMAAAGAAPGTAQAAVAGVAGAPNAQEIAARDQRRAASLWLLMKLAFGVYLFSQNGSIERIVLLHIAALVIFLHQTGRLRIVRRIVQPPGDAPPGIVNPPPVNQAQGPAFAQQQQQQQQTSQPTTAMASEGHGGSANDSSVFATTSSGAGNQASTSDTGSSSSTVAEGNRELPQQGGSSTLQQQPQTQQDQQQQQQQEQQPRVSTWRSIEHALLTFVTSLVPAPPPEIDPAVANAAAAGERGM